MKTQIAAFILSMGMTVAAQAETFNFTPIIDPNNPNDLQTLIALGDQLTMTVSEGSNNNALFTFTNDGNGGSIDSVITKVYFDDQPSPLFGDVSVYADSGANVEFREVPNSPLPGGNIPTFAFGTTDQFNAEHPHPFKGVNNTTASAGEFLTLSAVLTAGKTFADVLASLAAGDEADENYLRVGLRVSSIDDFHDKPTSFLDKGEGGGASPPPIPEPETYAMLLAGLGIMSAVARRRQRNNG